MASRTYLDVASLAPMHPAAVTAFQRASAVAWADPARTHREGRVASDLLSSARQAIATTMGGAPQRLAFTSGGTEAVHLAVRGTAAANRRRRPRIVSAAVEHSAVLAASDACAREHGLEHIRVAVDADGRVLVDEVAHALSGGALLVNVQHANHEVGTIQPVAQIADLCRGADALLHVDACQTFGRLPVGLGVLGADLVSVSAAKMGAGPGAGALLWSPRARLRPLLTGDEREARMRAGTQDVARIAAMAEVLLQLAPDDPDGPAAAERQRARALRMRLRNRLVALEDVAVHGPEEETLPHIVAASALYVDGQSLTEALDAAGYAVHSGSSCASTAGEPSHVLVAMGALTHGHVRVSFDAAVSEAHIDAFASAFEQAVTRLRARVAR